MRPLGSPKLVLRDKIGTLSPKIRVLPVRYTSGLQQLTKSRLGTPKQHAKESPQAKTRDNLTGEFFVTDLPNVTAHAHCRYASGEKTTKSERVYALNSDMFSTRFRPK